MKNRSNQAPQAVAISVLCALTVAATLPTAANAEPVSHSVKVTPAPRSARHSTHQAVAKAKPTANAGKAPMAANDSSKAASAAAVPARTTVPDPTQRQEIATQARKPGANGAPVDYSGAKRTGKASYYASSFSGRKMANGTRMNPQANLAASKTLPIGSKVEVKNLDNGRTAQVEITDRGPYVKDRIVDVTPKVADELELKHDGVAPVEVRPLVVPQPDGTLKQPTASQ